MKSFKRGRGPSMLGGVVAIAMAVFGVIWTIAASEITRDPFAEFGMGASGVSGVGSVFPLFGVVFIVIAVVIAVYNFKNATSKNRYSEFDIVDGHEEPDPLNQRYGNAGSDGFVHSDETSQYDRGFCPYCGERVEGDYLFCKRCGKQLPQ